MSKIPKNICYICGKKNPDTRDHIPPKNLFLSKYRNLNGGLITVPCHLNCNKKYELDDEYFRYCLCIPAYWTSEKARELWKTKLKNQLHRKESTGFLKYIRKLIEKAHVLDESGNPVAEVGVAFLDAKRMENVLIRIARGLFFKQYGFLPLNHTINCEMLFPNKTLKMITEFGISEKFTSVGGGIFKYYYLSDTDNNLNGLYIFKFFECIYFMLSLSSIGNKSYNPTN